MKVASAFTTVIAVLFGITRLLLIGAAIICGLFIGIGSGVLFTHFFGPT